MNDDQAVVGAEGAGQGGDLLVADRDGGPAAGSVNAQDAGDVQVDLGFVPRQARIDRSFNRVEAAAPCRVQPGADANTGQPDGESQRRGAIRHHRQVEPALAEAESQAQKSRWRLRRIGRRAGGQDGIQ